MTLPRTYTREELRSKGYKVIVDHYRFVKSTFGGKITLVPFYEIQNKDLIYAKGGVTYVNIVSPEGVESQAVARCNLTDNYRRRTGVSLCLNRAMAKLELIKQND